MSAEPSKAGGPGAPGARLAVLVLFAAAMGWLEAVVVVYIRGVIGFAHGPVVPTPEDVLTRFRQVPWLLRTEHTRELATLVMLAAVAWLGADRVRARLGGFLAIFGVWDIAYYASLYLLLRWPPSLGTVDVLFLIPPGPWWFQPVWVPVLISVGMIALGFKLLRGAPVRR